MRYISLDCETTGLNPDLHQIIEIAAVLDDTENPSVSIADLPTFHYYVKSKHYECEPMAAAMNARIFKALAEGQAVKRTTCRTDDLETLYYHGQQSTLRAPDGIEIIEADKVPKELEDFIQTSYPYNEDADEITERLTLAGKNIGSFDYQFLKKMGLWNTYLEPLITHRFLDVGNLFFEGKDKAIPSLEECRIRAGLPERPQHQALEDARLCVELVRFHLANTYRVASGSAKPSFGTSSI